jgi:hypothetical protein
MQRRNVKPMKTTNLFLVLLLGALLATGCGAAQNGQPATGMNVTCIQVSLNLPAALGSGYECQSVPENQSVDQGYIAIHPEYTLLTLKDYPWADSTLKPEIYAFPVKRYGELIPDLIPARVADLKSLISGGKTEAKELPLLPVFNSAQIFSSQFAVASFKNGKGIRFLTQYAQGIVPVNSQELFYTFQGLSADGQTWISAILPVSNPILPRDAKNPPNGQSMEEFARNYLAYKSDIVAKLNEQPAGSFTPDLAVLDELVKSISVKP